MEIIKKYSIPILILLTALSGFLCMDKGHELGDDFAMYVSQAEAIQKHNVHHLFTMNKYAMDHSDVTLGPYLYPPAYPIFLVPAIIITGRNLLVLKVWNWIFFLMFIWFFWKIVSKENSSFVRVFLTVCITFFNPKVIEMADRVIADLFFCGLCILFFYLLMVPAKRSSTSFFLGLVGLMAFETKENGIFLFAVLGIFLLFDKGEKEERKSIGIIKWMANNSVAFIVLIAGVSLVWFSFPSADANHWVMLRSINVHSVWHNAKYYFALIGGYPFVHLVTYLGNIGALVISYIVWFTALLGVFYFGRKCYLFIIWILLNMLLYIVWPGTQGIRYVLPIMPFFVFFFVGGISQIMQRVNFKYIYQTVLGSFIVICAVQVVATTIHYQKIDTNRAFSQDAVSLYEYAKKEIPQGSIVSAYKPRLFRLATGINAIRTDTYETLISSDANYVVFGLNASLDNKKFRIDSGDQHFKKVYTNRSYSLYRLNR